ncbi:unnamed protein product [marine sediment metagenome]|uniref:Uncharacterized protein n=1 Tax=marine sediment metagenome TaxID=412755 RepID=X1BCL1_9ZZZZ
MMNTLEIILLVYFSINVLLGILTFIICWQLGERILINLLYCTVALAVGLPIALFGLVQLVTEW